MSLTLTPNRPANTEDLDEFSLDVRVVVAHSASVPGNCDTSDGCGTSCAGTNSACNSTLAVY
jgi:FxLD family lantipeptide